MLDRWRLGRGWLVAGALAAGVPAVAQDQAATQEQAAAAPTVPAIIPTSAFAARSLFDSVPELSPDGQRVAVTLAGGKQRSLGIMNIDSGVLEQKVPIAGRDVGWFTWAGDKRVLLSSVTQFTVLDLVIRYEVVYLVDVDTGETKLIGGGADELVYVDRTGDFVLLAKQRGSSSDREVWRVWLDGSGHADELVATQRGVWHWLADDSGVVRVGLDPDGRKVKFWYRAGAQDAFRTIARIGPDDTDELWDVARLVSGTDEGLVLEPGPSGRMALRRFNYATRAVGDVVYENPDWDLEDFQVDDDGKPLAVQFTDDATHVVWLDPAMARLQRNFERALGTDQAFIAGRSRDGSRLLVGGASASNPGEWYVYTPATRELKAFAQMRPEIDPALLAPVKPVEYAARDGTMIRAYLTLPPGREAKGLPLIVMPHGGPYFIRDKLAYSDEVQLLANRGYAVLQPNYRGSGGYGEAFETLGKGEIGRRMQDDLDDAMDWAVAQGVADAKRVCLVGESYGGYAALWGVIRNPERYRCAASFAGVTEWDKQLKYDEDFFTREGRRNWRERIRGADRGFDLDSVSPARQAAQLTRPVLLVHGQQDSNVPFSQFEAMRNAMRRAHIEGGEFVVLEKSGHGFADAADEKAWYDALVAFLAKNNPAG
jgi:dipeptidyl aminopeptidase/acylaminoacyl peptidase